MIRTARSALPARPCLTWPRCPGGSGSPP